MNHIHDSKTDEKKEEAIHRSTRLHTFETRVNAVKHRVIDRVATLFKVITAEVVTDPRLA